MKSPWYDTDGGRCVCGPGQKDWIKKGECKACSLKSEVTEACPWAGNCTNSENQCQPCMKSPWYDTDGGRCVCGPGQKDWIKKGECKACPLKSEVTDACPWAGNCTNSENQCQPCTKS